MVIKPTIQDILKKYIVPDNHPASDYFQAIKELIRYRNAAEIPAETELFKQGH
jgi:hypothetical protein